MPSAASPGKINLFLEVPEKREDGFHNIDSVFAEIDLADTLEANVPSDNRLALTSDDPSLPCDGRNLVMRAAAALQEISGSSLGAEMFLAKRIPPGSGIGGGSSNAATALRLLNALWNCGLSTEQLAEVGSRLGSDVPFFLYGGVAVCQGRGEIITPVPAPAMPLRLGLVLPGIHSNTADAYRNIVLPKPGQAKSSVRFREALAAGDISAMEQAAFNRFETTVFKAIPRLGEMHNEVEALLDRPVRMSGSGSTLWFFLRSDEELPERIREWSRDAGVRVMAVSVMRDLPNR